MDLTIKISFPQPGTTQPTEESDPVSILLNSKIGLPMLLMLADVEFEYFIHLGLTLWKFQFGILGARRLMDSVVIQGSRPFQPTGRIHDDYVLKYFDNYGIRYSSMSGCTRDLKRLENAAKTLLATDIGLPTLRKIKLERPDIYNGRLRYLLIIHFGYNFVVSIFDVLIN